MIGSALQKSCRNWLRETAFGVYPDPLRRLADAARGLGSNLEQPPLALDGPEEVRQAAQAFNAMQQRLIAMVNDKAYFLAAVSHDLRTPLTRLQLSLALARKKGQQTTETDRIAYEAEQLEQLIAELLELSRVKLSTNETKVRLGLAESLSQVLDDAEFEADQQGKKITIDIDEAIELSHYPKSLSRAIQNLLRNAIRYAEQRVEVSLVRTGDYYEVRVNDDGPGVPIEGREKIFEPFSRLDASRDRRTGGFGLGLALVRRVSQSHGGQVEVAESPWGGASFRMTWVHLE